MLQAQKSLPIHNTGRLFISSELITRHSDKCISQRSVEEAREVGSKVPASEIIGGHAEEVASK